MITIKKIVCWSIFDSNGYPTLKGELLLSNEARVTASVPSTFSDGKFEAYELRDHQREKFDGYGVERAVYYVNNLIAPKLVGVSPLKQKEIDYWLIKADNTENKSVLGANTILLISTLVFKAGALINNLPLFQYTKYLYEKYFQTKIEIVNLPRPIFNLIDGGRHGISVDFQEFYVFFPTTNSLEEIFLQLFKLRNQLVEALKKRGVSLSYGNFGGFAPNFSKNIDPIEILIESAGYANFINGLNIYLGIDFAANNFYHGENYFLHDQSAFLNKQKYYQYVAHLTKNYHLLFVEDIFSNDDKQNWIKYFSEFSKEIYIAGDDLVGGNKKRLEEVIKNKMVNAINLKPTQVGTITETLEIINQAKKNNLQIIIGARNGETDDTSIVDISVGIQADFVKFGALNRGERIVKYNRLLEIEKEIHNLT